MPCGGTGYHCSACGGIGYASTDCASGHVVVLVGTGYASTGSAGDQVMVLVIIVLPAVVLDVFLLIVVFCLWSFLLLWF